MPMCWSLQKSQHWGSESFQVGEHISMYHKGGAHQLHVSRNSYMWVTAKLCPVNLFILLFILLFSHCHIRLFATTWTAAQQAPLSFTISWSLLKLMSIESVMSSNSLVLCPLLQGIFQPRDQTRVSCIGRWILYSWATWEAPVCVYFLVNSCIYQVLCLVCFFF